MAEACLVDSRLAKLSLAGPEPLLQPTAFPIAFSDQDSTYQA